MMLCFSMMEVLLPDLQFSNQRSYSSQLKIYLQVQKILRELINLFPSPFINLVFIKTLIAVVSEDAPDPFHWLRWRQSPETSGEMFQTVASPQRPVAGVIMGVGISQRHVGGVHPCLWILFVISKMTGPKIHTTRVKLGLISDVPIHVSMGGKSSSAKVCVRNTFN